MTARDDSELSSGTEADYAAIEAAVMETARGRWFLAEYARRNRTADTESLLAAILRLEGKIDTRVAAPAPTDTRLQHVGRAAERIRDVAWRLKRRQDAQDDASDLERLVTDLLQVDRAPAAAAAVVDDRVEAVPVAKTAPPPEDAPPVREQHRPQRPLPREIDFSALSFEDRMALVS